MLTDEEFSAAIDVMTEYAKHCLPEQKSFVPILEASFIGNEKALVMLPDLASMESRRDLFTAIGKEIRQTLITEFNEGSLLEMTTAIFASEVWVARALESTDPRSALAPSERADKDEAVIIMGLTPDGRCGGSRILFDRIVDEDDPKQDGLIIPQQTHTFPVAALASSEIQSHLLEAFIRGYYGRFPVIPGSIEPRFVP